MKYSSPWKEDTLHTETSFTASYMKKFVPAGPVKVDPLLN